MKILIATHKSWNIDRAKAFMEREPQHEVKIVTTKEEMTVEMVDEFAPDYIFFPHWSFYIPSQVYENRECVVFHMTDLPFGRGGSPLQNLIVRGIERTKISAIKVCGQLDAGPIYLKEDLELSGTAEEIYDRASDIIFSKMLPRIINEKPIPQEQQGEPVIFKRRTMEDGELHQDMEPRKIYDYIRMLDAEGYPNAFIRLGDYRLDFSQATLEGDEITAKVVFRREH